MLKVLHWAGGKLVDGLAWLGEIIDKGGDLAVDEFDSLFMIAAMVGLFITMSGSKKLGTKVSSASFLIYLAIRLFL